ncbi:MAG: YlbF family regulator [Intestinibacter sp.]|uniref:YlbF family regulator n=1 Tax=Intestinibacter sp. TaxID=1965304 RepID=UPI003F17200A
MNINQMAQELARLIKNSDEFKTMNKYKREIEKNKSIKKQLDNYMNKKDKIYTKYKIDEANRKISQLDREYSKVFQTPLVENYFKSTQRFNLLMQNVYKSIEEELLK